MSCVYGAIGTDDWFWDESVSACVHWHRFRRAEVGGTGEGDMGLVLMEGWQWRATDHLL